MNLNQRLDLVRSYKSTICYMLSVSAVLLREMDFRAALNAIPMAESILSLIVRINLLNTAITSWLIQSNLFFILTPYHISRNGIVSRIPSPTCFMRVKRSAVFLLSLYRLRQVYGIGQVTTGRQRRIGADLENPSCGAMRGLGAAQAEFVGLNACHGILIPPWNFPIDSLT
jgi:hypothetical protein